MSQSFGMSLKQFALAIDIVSEDILRRVLGKVASYVASEFGAHFPEFLVSGMVDGRAGLTALFHPNRENWAESLKKENGEYNGQVTYAFHKRRHMWIVGQDKAPLLRASAYHDLWSNSPKEEIPRYKLLEGNTALFADTSESRDQVRTQIIVPLRHNSKAIGVLSFESILYLEIDEAIRTEVSLIGEAIALLYQLWRSHEAQTKNTYEAMDRLETELEPRERTMREFFFACGKRADEEVVGIVREVLSSVCEEADAEWTVNFWPEGSVSGSVHERLWEGIRTCRIGICYFSEGGDGGEQRFVDNPNVLFEAGMLYALSLGQESRKTWIPIREAFSSKLPFDLADWYVLEIRRQQDGTLFEQSFKADLKKRLRAAMKE